MRRIATLALLAVAASAHAQLDQAEVGLHPQYPGDQPFVLEVGGIWNGNCNPGNARADIRVFDGEQLFVLFEAQAQPCISDNPMRYRQLVDVSSAFTGSETYGGELDITISFAGERLELTLPLECPQGTECPSVADTLWPEPGLYQGEDLQKQGLLLARQGERLAIYPLSYDAQGSAEWLFGAAQLSGDLVQAPLYQASGGQCLGCPPPDEPPQLEVIAGITLVFDNAGTLQVSLDGGPFVEYRQTVFGYTQLEGLRSLVDLSGRWAILDSGLEETPSGGIPPALALPQVFDFQLDRVVHSPPLADPPVTTAIYRVRDLEGVQLTELHCYNHTPVPCFMGHPDYPGQEHAYDGTRLSTDRMLLEDRWPADEGEAPASGVIVRVGP